MIQVRYKTRIRGPYPLKIVFQTSPLPSQNKTIMTTFVAISSTQNDSKGAEINLVRNAYYLASRKAIKVSR